MALIGSTTTSACFLFFHLGAYQLSDYNSVTAALGHYAPVPPPQVGSIISHLFAVDRSHVSEIHGGLYLLGSERNCLRDLCLFYSEGHLLLD